MNVKQEALDLFLAQTFSWGLHVIQDSNLLPQLSSCDKQVSHRYDKDEGFTVTMSCILNNSTLQSANLLLTANVGLPQLTFLGACQTSGASTNDHDIIVEFTWNAASYLMSVNIKVSTYC